jgi:hypothetical protein
MTIKSSSSRINAYNARNSKLRALTPPQIKSLRRWLITDGLTYDQARTKLRERFGVSLSPGTICRFWYTRCLSTMPPTHDRKPPVLLDVVLQSSQPIRVTVKETRVRLRFKVGTMRQIRLSKRPTFTVSSAGDQKGKP